MSEKKKIPEPFGYFKAEPFGWTDCADTDDCAIPLYDIETIKSISKQRDELLNALHVALPFVEDHEGDTFYKPGAVKKVVQTIRSTIASATDQFRDATKMIGAQATANYPHGSLGEAVESKGGAA